MASASITLSEDHFLCSICRDVFTDPVTTPCGHNYCKACITHYWDTNDVYKCPLCQGTFNNRPKVSVNAFISEMVHQIRSNKLKEYAEAKTEDKVQQMIQERQEKIQEVKRSVELSRKESDAVIAVSVQVFTALIGCIERSQDELIDVIKEKQKTSERQAEGFIKNLQQEVTQLEKRSSELKQLSHTDDHLHPLQNFTSINTEWTPTKDHQEYVGTLWTAVSQLKKTLRQEIKEKLCDVELKRIQQYEVDVTLDPDTAHPNLILSEDGKQMSHGNKQKNLPDNTERFSYCLHVLGKQSFFSGRVYYEVQVTGKTGWLLGVVRESINRKDVIPRNPNNGYWTIWLNNGNEYRADASPSVHLPVSEKVQKVGVFVDYEEGLVSFYDVETRDHLYSFTDCTFSEKVFPFFSPFTNDGGRNSAPLIISPVTMK